MSANYSLERYPESEIRISGYQLLEMLGTTTSGALIFRGQRNTDRLPVLLKIVLEEGRDDDTQCLQKEYALLHALPIQGIACPIDYHEDADCRVLVLEYFEGRLLDTLLDKQPIPISTALEIAINLVETLSGLHSFHYTHQELQPSNILVAEGKTCLMDLSFVACSTQDVLSSIMSGQGSLAYISPEQTGRMNRAIDHRTDYYSLGVILYGMLAGRLPFESGTASGWIYSHMARQPQLLSELIHGFPRPLSDIVAKLLCKDAEERYQSAAGIKHDLSKCLREWQKYGRIKPFKLALRDIPDRLNLPHKLYGREMEIATLLDVFIRVAQSGKPEVALVKGYAGIGKSALVYELRDSIARKQGYFLAGKFEQYKSDIPYSTLTQAFRHLLSQILSESEEQLAIRKQALQMVLGEHGQLMVDLLPQLELIIGKPPEAPELPPHESQNRFHMMFRQFISVFASREHPMVLFLDDLQWADPATMQLVEYLLTHSETRYLMLIGAYRDNEIDRAYPLKASIDWLRERLPLVEIHVHPLSRESLVQLLSNTFHSRAKKAEPLADLMLHKTGGNPFFTQVFLTVLYRDGLIRFDSKAGKWRWSIDEISRANVTDNMVELTIGQMNRLPERALEILKWAACIGNRFDLDILTQVTNLSPASVIGGLEPAVNYGFLSPGAAEPDCLLQHNPNQCINTWFWSHDRFQQAAYSQIHEESLPGIHLTIGKTLKRRLKSDSTGEELLTVTTHLNKGAVLIQDGKERLALAELNLAAGRKAQAAIAYLSAIEYLSKGQSLLPSTRWESDYSLTYELYLEHARCEWLVGNTDTAESLLEELFEHAQSRAELAAVYRIKMELSITQGNMTQGLQIALQAFSELYGLSFPLHPTSAELEAAVTDVVALLEKASVEDLLNAPLMTDMDMQAAVSLLSASLPLGYGTDPYLHDLMSCQMVRLIFQYGNSAESPHGYVTFAIALANVYNRWDQALCYGKLACDIVEKYNFTVSQSLTYVLFAILASYIWPLRKTLPYLYKAQQSALKYGHSNYNMYASMHILFQRLKMGDTLEEIAEEVKKQLAFAETTNHHVMHNTVVAIERFVKTLRGETDALGSYDAPDFNDADFEQTLMTFVESFGIQQYYMYKSLAKFLAGDYEAAVAAIVRLRPYVLHQLKTIIGLGDECRFLSVLAFCAHYPYTSEENRLEYLETLNRDQEWFRVKQIHCPQNFLSRYLLISAEVARVRHQDIEAFRLYEQAIKASKEDGVIQCEAIANERLGTFCLQLGLETSAYVYLYAARECYQRWGACAKVKQLEVQYDRLRAWITVNSIVNPEIHLDFQSVIQASQAISGKIVLEQLLDTLMKILLESSGSQKACLIFVDQERLHLAAEANVLEQSISVVLNSNRILSSVLPLSVLNYVHRSLEKVILDDAIKVNPFFSDTYFQEQKIRSVLCLPLLRQGRLIGLLYLENNLITQAFNEERRIIIEVLASQAAIAIENAKLYKNLEEENLERRLAEAELSNYKNHLENLVAQRTEELMQTNETLTRTNQKLAEATNQLEHKIYALDAVNKELESFSYSVSHDLRAPLRRINGVSKAIYEDYKDKLGEAGEKYLWILIKEAQQMSEQINEMLNLSRLTAGPMHRVNVNLSELADEIAISLQQQEPGRKVTFRIEPNVIA